MISGLPGFATSDTTARTFTIETDVFGDVNTYTVRIDSTISVPLDRDDPTNRQEHQQFYTFELNVYDACSSTVFIDTMVINPALVQTYPKRLTQEEREIDRLRDQISKDYGNQDGYTLCGARDLKLMSPSVLPSFISFSLDPVTQGFKIAVQTTNHDDIGLYDFTFRQFLVKHEDDVYQDISF